MSIGSGGIVIEWIRSKNYTALVRGNKPQGLVLTSGFVPS